ncbi:MULTISPECIES: hypothetical protein [Rothia]|uniref:Uncharacterized protein n=1 Tax=Rothia mucilaginosa TaxID=43675 RepID=A0A930L7L7_9MICC|nr:MULTISPECIES: hypothetical protein [Rothia]MBF1657832.1 hypothetical protein [Rothia mucilaginosa]OFQ64876.1 hypothetical protein HMPREF2927_06175 [Rothia sp. HMSC061E04]
MVQQNVESAQQEISPEPTQAPAEQEEQYLYYRLDDALAEMDLDKWKNSGVPLRNVDCGEIDTNLEILSIGGNEIPMTILEKLRRIIDEELDSLKAFSDDRDKWKYEYSHRIGKALHKNLHMIRGEAESIEVWQFIGMRVLPAAAFARFAPSKEVRHIGNLRRHVLRRTWLTYDLLGEVMDEGGYLTEDDLNQILDRTSISTNRDLALALARTLNSVGAPTDYGLERGVSARDIKRKIAEELTVRMGVEMVQHKSYEDMCALLETIKNEVIEVFKQQEGITEEQDEGTWDSDSEVAEDYESEDVEIEESEDVEVEELEDSEDLDTEADEYDESYYEDFSDEESEEEEESADFEVDEAIEAEEPEAEESEAEESEHQEPAEPQPFFVPVNEFRESNLFSSTQYGYYVDEEPEERPSRLRTPQSKLKAKLEQSSPEVTADEEANEQASEAKTHRSKLTPPKSKMGQFWDNMPWKR